jgi:DeoR/GlpR family transcriptional regulator of sugar metabolism
MTHDDAAAVVETLAEEYDATPEVLRRDLEALLQDLEDNGLVTRTAGAAGDEPGDGPTADTEPAGS